MDQKIKISRIDYIEIPAATTDQLLRAKSFFTEVFGWTYEDWGEDYFDSPDSSLASGINADPDY
jgi:predicted enzyme related to lactoylglutathione lyase